MMRKIKPKKQKEKPILYRLVCDPEHKNCKAVRIDNDRQRI